MNGKCTVLVNSCDAYEETWLPFFTLFEKYWAECKYPVFLNTETKYFSSASIEVQVSHSQKKGWSGRLLDALKRIKTPYVIMLLDDFFLDKPVHQDIIDSCVNWMNQDKNIATFSFVPTLWEDGESGKYAGFQKRPYRCDYKVNCQAAIWRREALIKLIRKQETPWDFEIYGSSRARRYVNWEFYTAERNSTWAFSYNWIAGGAVHRGRWTEGTKELLEKNGIVLDFSVRGMDESKIAEYAINPEHHKSQTFMQKVIKVLLHWRSYL